MIIWVVKIFFVQFFCVFLPSLEEFSMFVVKHTVKSFGIVNKVEVEVFLELSGFFDDPNVGNLISGSSAFSKSSLESGSSRFMYL